MSQIFIGTAGWSIPSHHAESFSTAGTHLARYGRRLNAVEINSSFYRPHRRATYERWADSVPDSFRFAVKLPKTITHEARLAETKAAVTDFCDGVAGLGAKLGALLVQLPPSLAFDKPCAQSFFADLHGATRAPIVCEPRHASWFTAEVNADLAAWKIERVAADPPVAEGGDEPGGRRDLTYFRMHGAPRIYYSSYDENALAALRTRLSVETCPTWCIFDNTAAGAALGHALALGQRREDAPSL